MFGISGLLVCGLGRLGHWKYFRLQDDRAGLEERFEVRQDLRPAVRDGIDQFGAFTLDAVRSGQFHCVGDGLDLHGAERPALGLELGLLVAPANAETLRRLKGDDLAGISHAAVGKHELPRSADLPIGLEVGAKPILLREFLARERRPQTLGRCADIGDIDETALACVTHGLLLPVYSLVRTARPSGGTQTFVSSVPRSR